MKFIDEVKIMVESGKGGDGRVGFRREKYVDKGGPNGGDGGNGGNVFFEADENENTLLNFRGRKEYRAGNGEIGGTTLATGKTGADLTLKVPVGTLIRNDETGEIIADLKEHQQVVKVASGGSGGRGNHYFKSSTLQTPQFAQNGKEGETLNLHLELKLIADAALVGLPNAGKSTLISSISAARPKIADYPFTTLEPNLGVVRVGEKSVVVADIPGLIEKASEGKGLGIKFLKHIERTRALIHLIDCSMCLEPFEAYEDYVTIRNELSTYSENLTTKKELICLTKIDAMSDDEIKNFQDYFQQQLDKKVLPISSVSGKNIDILKELLLKLIESN